MFYLTYFRYNVLTPETYPQWRGDVRAGIKHLMNFVQMDTDQYQLGKTKVFIKNPESVRYIVAKKGFCIPALVAFLGCIIFLSRENLQKSVQCL